MKRTILISFLTLLTFVPTFGQEAKETKELKYSNKWTLGSDLFQPFLLGGFNINVTYMTNRFVFDYSHGIALELGDNLQTDAQKDLNASIKLPWTTGPGFGYRITDALDTRIDFKAHKLDVELLDGQQKLDYTQFTFGPGAFYRFYFGKKTGFGLEASVRYWFDLGNSLDNLNDGNYEFTDTSDANRTFDTDLSSGFGANIALIYTFGKNKK